MHGSKRQIWGTLAVALAVAISAAAMTATEAIKERQKAMENNRDAMKKFGAIVKKEQPFEADVVAETAATIAGDLEHAAALFPEGSQSGDVQTWAKPEIWDNRGHFDELLDNARQAAIEMESVTSAEEFPAALGKLGNACKTCHDAYRLPKN